jgi:hypothetical protein
MPSQDAAIHHRRSSDAGAEGQKHYIRNVFGRADPNFTSERRVSIIENWHWRVQPKAPLPIQAFKPG